MYFHTLRYSSLSIILLNKIKTRIRSIYEVLFETIPAETEILTVVVDHLSHAVEAIYNFKHFVRDLVATCAL